MERVLGQLVEKLQKAYGDRLISVVLYGSAAAGDHHQHFSDLNVLCVLTRVTAAELKPSSEIFRWWRHQGNPAPLLLSERELRTSTDCFAVEFHDLKLHHRLLYGKDLISNLDVDNSFYRAQVEHELRAKLLRLRQKASGMLSDKSLLRRLLVDSLSTFCVLFRHALVLQGVEAGTRKREIIEQAHQSFGIDPTAFEKLLAIRERHAKAGDLDPAPVLDSYLQGISTVIEAVDRIEK